jgi:hypothetical protein
MASNGVFAAATLALAVAALARGRGHALTLWPQWDLIGHGSSSPLVKGMGLANILPILLNCDVCHMSLHPLMALLKPYSHARMRALVATTLSGCNVLYWVSRRRPPPPTLHTQSRPAVHAARGAAAAPGRGYRCRCRGSGNWLAAVHSL